MPFNALCCAMAMLGIIASSARSEVILAVDPSRPVGESRLLLGITHTHHSNDHKAAIAANVTRADRLLADAARLQNTHIMGWGAGNPMPKPGEYDFSSLDRRIAMMRKLNLPIVITLCTAPGWMKPSGENWKMDDRVHPEHLQAFAELCVEIARRYPDVRQYQVWNEFKGYWSGEQNNWDSAAYTDLYNTVYDALKAHDATLKVGGFYLVASGTGSESLGKTGRDTFVPWSEKELQVLDHWLANKHGADFIAFDRAVKDYHDPNTYTVDEIMKLTPMYARALRVVGERTELPIWLSEYYCSLPRGTDPQAIAAAYASAYKHMIEGGASVALLWNPNEGEANLSHHLYTDVRKADGGEPTPHYAVYKAFADHFPPKTPLVAATSSSPEVEVIASPRHAIIINKRSSVTDAKVNDAALTLQPYEVRVLDLTRVAEPD